MATSVTFEVPMKVYELLELEEDELQALRSACVRVMPSDAGLDVTSVDITPSVYEKVEQTLEQNLQDISDLMATASEGFSLPSDILAKGQQMADAYLYLYSVENYLRLFIETIAKNTYGDDYFNKLQIPKGVANSIAVRKDLETKNRWIGVRGDSNLYYLDFKDLGDVIQNNWDLFKPHFPDQAWITSKISELANCRNLVAHNSYIGDHERDVIKVSFQGIIRQLNSHMK